MQDVYGAIRAFARLPLRSRLFPALCLAGITALSSGCTIRIVSPQAESPALGLSISSDQPLYSVTHAFGGTVPGAGGAAAAGVGIVAGGAGSAVGAGAGSATSGATPALGGVAASDSHSVLGDATDLQATVSLHAAPVGSSVLECLLDAPFSAITCLTSGISITGADITTAGSLSLNATVENSGISQSFQSNALATKHYTITQVSNTTGDNSTDDVVDQPGAVLNGEYYFQGVTTGGLLKLFRTNGTAVTQVTNLFAAHELIDQLTPYNNELYFFSNRTTSLLPAIRKMFKTDGTTVTQVSNLQNNNATTDISLTVSPQISKMIVMGGELYFTASGAGASRKVFKYQNNVGSSFTRLSNTNPAGADFLSAALAEGAVSNGTYVFFWGANSNGRYKFFRTDGTTTTQVSNTVNDANANDTTFPLKPAVAGGEAYFSAINASGGSKLHKTDGTTVTEVSNTSGAAASNDNPQIIGVVGSTVFFSAANIHGATKLFRTDGTTVTQVSNLSGDNTVSDTVLNYPASIAHNGELYFKATHPDGGQKLYASDGTSIRQVSNTRGSNALNDSPKAHIVFDGMLLFSSLNGGGVSKLYAYDGSQVTQISDTANDSTLSDSPDFFQQIGSTLYFSSNCPQGGGKIFKMIAD